jgi:DNA uptake protein ComE-like DNA-binding protein
MRKRTRSTARAVGLAGIACLAAAAALASVLTMAGQGRVRKIHLNFAPATELQKLPGVTPPKADQIIAARPYRTVDELARAGFTTVEIDALRPFAMAGWTPNPNRKFYRLAPGERIDLNRATPEMLEALPGIGKARALAIIENRPYARIEDIMKVKGIKAKTFQRLRALIKV